MLTASDLAVMRETLVHSLPEVGEIRRVTEAPDGAGGTTENEDAIATLVCRVSPAGYAPQEKAIAEKLGALSSWTITFPHDADIQEKDRVAVGTRLFEVVAVLGPRSYEVACRVLATEVR